MNKIKSILKFPFLALWFITKELSFLLKKVYFELTKPLVKLITEPPEEIFKFIRNIFISTAILTIGYNLSMNINGFISVAGISLILFSAFLYLWNSIYFVWHKKELSEEDKKKEIEDKKKDTWLTVLLHLIVIDLMIYLPIFLSILFFWLFIAYAVYETEYNRIKNEGILFKKFDNIEEGFEQIKKSITIGAKQFNAKEKRNTATDSSR